MCVPAPSPGRHITKDPACAKLGSSTRVIRLPHGPPPASLPPAPAAGVADASWPMPRRVPRSGYRRSRVGTSPVAPVAGGRLPEQVLGFRGDHSLFLSISASRNPVWCMSSNWYVTLILCL